MPGDHSIHLSLPIPTTINNGSAHLHLGVTVEPLLAQHGDERSEERSTHTRVKDRLDVNDSGIRAIPLRESGICTGRGVAKRDVGDDLEELVVHFLEIRLELALNVNNENGRDQ